MSLRNPTSAWIGKASRFASANAKGTVIARTTSSVIISSRFAARSARTEASVARMRPASPSTASWVFAGNARDRAIAPMPINTALTKLASMVQISVRTSTAMAGRCAREATSARTIAKTGSAGNAQRTNTALQGSIAPTEAAVNPLTAMAGAFAPGTSSANISALTQWALPESAGSARRTTTAVQAGIATNSVSAKANTEMVGLVATRARSVRAGIAVGPSVRGRSMAAFSGEGRSGDHAFENTLRFEHQRCSLSC